jgi:hypothetical protein
MSKSPSWRPSWWNEEVHGSAWNRVKEAMERDWTQTKHELGVGGHELNQTAADTAKQASGSEPIPPLEQANPPKVIGDWSEAEIPYGYGHAARRQFGSQHPQWTPELEDQLRRGWGASQTHAPIDWNAAKPLVRRGYDYDETAKSWPAHKH